jgi:hypothetical protein
MQYIYLYGSVRGIYTRAAGRYRKGVLELMIRYTGGKKEEQGRQEISNKPYFEQRQEEPIHQSRQHTCAPFLHSAKPPASETHLCSFSTLSQATRLRNTPVILLYTQPSHQAQRGAGHGRNEGLLADENYSSLLQLLL